jgi:uncharacterized protein
MCSVNLISIPEILQTVRTVAVLGIRSEKFASKPAFYVAEDLQRAGLKIIPVPIYELEVTSILGEPVFRRLVDISIPIDVVDVFRRPEDIPSHLDDIIAKRPRIVWFQSGIRNDDAASRLIEQGIHVIQDRCLMVDYRTVHQK